MISDADKIAVRKGNKGEFMERKRFVKLSDGQIIDTRTRDCDVHGDEYIESMMVGNVVYTYRARIIKQADTIEELKSNER